MGDLVEFIPKDDWEKHLAAEAVRSDAPLRLPKELNRRRVVSAFMDAFELVGGTPKLVEWAMASDENYGAFLKLYARLLPPQNDTSMEESKEKVIKHILPRSRLDV